MSIKVYGYLTNLKPRYPQKTVEKKIYEPKSMQVTHETRQATEQDLYDAGWVARDIIINGKNCLERQGSVYWCED